MKRSRFEKVESNWMRRAVDISVETTRRIDKVKEASCFNLISEIINCVIVIENR